MPARLTPLSVATPDALVVAVPAFAPLSLKVIVFPLSAALSLFLFSVADRLTVWPKVPEAGLTVSVDADRLLIVSDVLAFAALLCFVSPAYDEVMVDEPVADGV